MKWRQGMWLSIGVLILGIGMAMPLVSGHVRAADNPAIVRGLLITPTRAFTTQPAGTTRASNFTIANLTTGTITVDLSVKRFAVNDYTDDYRFDTPDNNWVTLGVQTATLQSHTSKEIPYTVTVPAGTAGGGHYYTLFASANLQQGGLKSKVQATLLMYLTVQGNLRKTSVVQSGSVQQFAFGRQIGYNLVVRNTGNVHYFVYTSGHVNGWLTGPKSSEETHLLLPASTRILQGSVRSPLLPGVYKLSYGFRADDGHTTNLRGTVMYIPPWFVALVLAALLIARVTHQRRRKRHAAEPKPDDPEA